MSQENRITINEYQNNTGFWGNGDGNRPPVLGDPRPFSLENLPNKKLP
jgi:hypothetical protein